MKRPERIPQDIWDRLTVNEAAEAGLLGGVPREWLTVGGSALLCDADDTALVAHMLAENIDAESVLKACNIVRMRKPVKYNGPRPTRIPEDIWDKMTVREALLYGFLDQQDDYKGLNLDALVCMYPSTSRIAKSIRCKLKRLDDRALDGKYRAIRTERAQNARQSACPKHDDEPLNIDPSEFDPRNELVHAAKREINVALQMGLSSLELQKALERVLGKKTEDIKHALTRAFDRSKRQDIQPNQIHVHTCTNCFEHECCFMDCTIEPDLGTTTDGLPFGSHLRCAACGPEPKEPDPLPEQRAALAAVRGGGTDGPSHGDDDVSVHRPVRQSIFGGTMFDKSKGG